LAQDGLITVSKFAEMSGPEFYYEAPTNESFGAGPYGVIDPYEKKIVRIIQSRLPQSGEGLLMLRDFPTGRCTSYFSGYLYDFGEEALAYSRCCIDNETLTMNERREYKKYTLRLILYKTEINIPPEVDKPGMFQPTLGPKVKYD